MPHITVRMYAGRSEEQKRRLAEVITNAFITTLGSAPDAISVGIEDIAPDDWMAKVYEPEISGKEASLYKRPGYGPAK